MSSSGGPDGCLDFGILLADAIGDQGSASSKSRLLGKIESFIKITENETVLTKKAKKKKKRFRIRIFRRKLIRQRVTITNYNYI